MPPPPLLLPLPISLLTSASVDILKLLLLLLAKSGDLHASLELIFLLFLDTFSLVLCQPAPRWSLGDDGAAAAVVGVSGVSGGGCGDDDWTVVNHSDW